MPDPLFGQPHRSHPFDPNPRHFHHPPQDCGIARDAADDIDAVRRNRVGSHAHRRAPEKNGQHLPGPPEGDVTDP